MGEGTGRFGDVAAAFFLEVNYTVGDGVVLVEVFAFLVIYRVVRARSM